MKYMAPIKLCKHIILKKRFTFKKWEAGMYMTVKTYRTDGAARYDNKGIFIMPDTRENGGGSIFVSKAKFQRSDFYLS